MTEPLAQGRDLPEGAGGGRREGGGEGRTRLGGDRPLTRCGARGSFWLLVRSAGSAVASVARRLEAPGSHGSRAGGRQSGQNMPKPSQPSLMAS